jgi:hypothetical protein
MHDDPIAMALRSDAERLLAEAPAPDAARMWHAMQAARAARLARLMNLCGWGLRAGLVLVLALAAAIAPRTALGLLPAVALIGWLTSGICTLKGMVR